MLHEHECTIQRWPVTFLWNISRMCMYHPAWQPVTFLWNISRTCMYHPAVADSQSLFCGTLHEHVCTIQQWLTASHFSVERCMNMRCCRLFDTSSWPSTSCICILYAIGQKWIRAFMQLMHENLVSNHSVWEPYRHVTSLEIYVYVQCLHLPNTDSQPTLLPFFAVVAYA